MAHDVFISHSKKDKPVADALCAALENAKIRCWIAPRDVHPGGDWASEIANAVEQAKVMVLVYSAHSSESVHVRKEITLAVSSASVIVPLKIDGTPLTGSMQYYLSDTHWLDALNPPTAEQILQVVETVCSILGVEGAPCPPIKDPHRASVRRRMAVIAAITVGVFALGGFGVYAFIMMGKQSSTGSKESTSTVEGTGAIATYGDVRNALPPGAAAVDLVATITTTFSDASYYYLAFTGTWEGHEVLGDLNVTYDGRCTGASITKMDGVLIDWADHAALDAAYADNEPFERFMNNLAQALYAPQLTWETSLDIAGMRFEPGDQMTLDRNLRLTPVTW
jgi:hypothetical protein